MEHAGEPCASLPKTHLTLDLTLCQHHQAWTLNAHAYLEDGASITDVVPFTTIAFGPFDGPADVSAVAVERFLEAFRQISA